MQYFLFFSIPIVNCLYYENSFIYADKKNINTSNNNDSNISIKVKNANIKQENNKILSNISKDNNNNISKDNNNNISKDNNNNISKDNNNNIKARNVNTKQLTSKKININNNLKIQENNIQTEQETKNKTKTEDLILERVQNYLKNLPDFIIDFKQISNINSNISAGTLIVSKKYGLRCNYFEPHPLLIILNNSNIAVYDYKLNSLIKDSIQFDLWNFLLTGSFGKSSEIIEITSADNQDHIVMQYENSFVAKLTFSNKKILNNQKKEEFIITSIASIEIIENETDSIILEFSDLRFIIDIDKNLFILRDPNIFGKPKRLNKKDLSKMYQLKK
ncbi:MAG: outer membrane lipoprotein carrier protein LolA [Rickettsiales bacterium]